ncbi:MAG: hypothetical protein ACREJG_02575, partial [Candidatus Rokuibacteriota bacterium]
MKARRNFFIIALISAALAVPAPGHATTEWKEVHGTVEKVEGSTLTFKADDGRTLSVDMEPVDPAIQKVLKPGEGATLIGSAGAEANQFTARYIQQDSSNPARRGKVVGRPASDRKWQEVHGTVGKVEGSMLTLEADDGRTLSVDMAPVNPVVQQALKPGDGATVVGFAGTQANQLTARYIQQDSSNPERGGKVAGPAGQDAKAAVDEKAWQRIHGTVQAVEGSKLTLKADDGRTLNVDMAQVSEAVRKALTPGEGATVIGHYTEDRNTV